MTTKKKPTQTLAPSPLLDAHGNPTPVSAGQLIESAWGNSVAGRTISRFPNKAALDASTPVGAGALAVTLDTGVFWVNLSAVWRATTIGSRPSFRLIGGGAGQALPGGSVPTRCIWTTEASDPFNTVSIGQFTVPAGFNGRWTFEWSVIINPGDTGQNLVYLQGVDRYGMSKMPIIAGAGSTVHGGSVSLVMGVGWTASVDAYTSGVATTMNTSTDQYFHGYYQGPV